MTLTHTIQTATTELIVTVEYDKFFNLVDRIISTKLLHQGKLINITGLMVKHFDNDLNKLIDNVDWREVANKELTEA